MMKPPHNVETLVVLQPIGVDTDSDDRHGLLVMANGLLVGVLVRLDTPGHQQLRGWFLEPASAAWQAYVPPPSTRRRQRPDGSGNG